MTYPPGPPSPQPWGDQPPQWGGPPQQWDQPQQWGAPGWSPPPPPQPPEQPSTIRGAVATMWIGAVLSILGGVSGFLMQDDLRDEVQRQIDVQGEAASGFDADTFVTLALIAGAVGGLIGATLWIVHAVATGKGRSWARISGTVLFAISALFFLVGLAQPAPALSRIQGVVQEIVAVVAVVLIWLPASSAYVRDSDRARRGH